MLVDSHNEAPRLALVHTDIILCVPHPLRHILLTSPIITIVSFLVIFIFFLFHFTPFGSSRRLPVILAEQRSSRLITLELFLSSFTLSIEIGFGNMEVLKLQLLYSTF